MACFDDVNEATEDLSCQYGGLVFITSTSYKLMRTVIYYRWCSIKTNVKVSFQKRTIS